MGWVAVVDYHKGNLSSVARGLGRAGLDARITDDAEKIVAADAVVLPGVGAFADAMGFIGPSGQGDAIRESVERGRPFLGICLGLQLLFSRGDEGSQGWTEGLSLFPGSCTRLRSDRLKVPHVGWDSLDLTGPGHGCPLLQGVAEGANMYFTHSYALDSDVPRSLVAAQTHYTRSFASVIWNDVVFGTQFHPEKSSGQGQIILDNFAAIVKGA